MQVKVLEVLDERGLIDATTSPELGKILEEPIRFYIGFDPTAESLHLGNLLGLVVARHLQRAGHECVALLGGATGLIGDPSGKSKERQALDRQVLAKNMQGICADIERFLGESDEHQMSIVDNASWWSEISFISFIGDIGRYFRMGPMLGKEMVRNRLESEAGLSFTEFTYQLLQAYDFLHLFRTRGVLLQIGGSDQWGNMTSGTELVRKVTGENVYALTFPLLTKEDGTKFGKSESGALWLNGALTTPYDFYQYLIRLPDREIIKMMRLLTFIPIEEIEEWKRRMGGADYIANSAQKRLAQALTEMVHGEEGVEQAERLTAELRPGVEGTGSLTLESFERLSEELPIIQLKRAEVEGSSLIELFVEVGLVKSRGETRRLIRNRGIRVNKKIIEDENFCLSQEDLIGDRYLLLGIGKKNQTILRVQGNG